MAKDFVIIRHDEDGASRLELFGGKGPRYRYDSKGRVRSMGPSPVGRSYGFGCPGTRFSYIEAVRMVRRMHKRQRNYPFQGPVTFRIKHVKGV